MDSALLRIVEARLDADGAGDHDWAMLVLAACEGLEALDAVLGGAAHEARDSTAAAAAEGEPLGAYLRSITVEGFRGIGPARTLEVQPGPGLTLVIGRNGSGKSSFAEGLEILLTASNWRWRERSSVWRQGWRNLHQPSPTTVAGEFAIEGKPGTTKLVRQWADGASLEHSEVRGTSVAELGWGAALETYRPFLSYSELGSMFNAGPTALHDRLSSILGLGELDVAQQLLKEARLPRSKALTVAKNRLAPLLERMSTLADDRAARVHAALKGRAWDLITTADVLSQPDDGSAGETGILRSLANLNTPTVEETLGLTERIVEVIARRAALSGTLAGEASLTAGLLRQALAFHDEHGDGDCPVCGREAAIDDAWRASAEAKASQLEASAGQVRTLEREERMVLDRTAQLLVDPPAILERASEVGMDSGALVESWTAYAEVPRDDLAKLADELERLIDPLSAAADELRSAAREELARREDLWRPIAVELAGWLPEARAADQEASRIPDLEKAEKWLKAASVGIRQERFAPIAESAKTLWKTLSQNSSVALDDVVLEGTGPSRHVTLDVTIDGVEGAGLGVMSQGELNAIALSLFLPRVTLPESPFRFVVIDDPVQSMDPSRVDGLALALASVATARQVVVFTHDDRLPEAVRRMNIDARVIEVTRRERSEVDLRPSGDPVTRNLDDARALARTTELPELVAQQVVPNFCRLAIEAAAVEVVRRRRIGKGIPHAAVEDTLANAPKTTSKLALAIFDDVNRGGDVARRVAQWGEPEADALGISTRGSHSGFRGDLEALVRGTDRLCRRLRELT